MTHWHEDYGEFDEMPDEHPEEEAQRLDEMVDIELPDVYWANDIERIPDQEIKKKEIEIGEKHNKKWKEVEEKVDSGEITEVDYFGELICKRWPEERKHTTRCGIESEGLTFDDLGDLAEDIMEQVEIESFKYTRYTELFLIPLFGSICLLLLEILLRNTKYRRFP